MLVHVRAGTIVITMPKWIVMVAAAVVMTPSLLGSVFTASGSIYGGPYQTSCSQTSATGASCGSWPIVTAVPFLVSVSAGSDVGMWGNSWVPADEGYGPEVLADASASEDLVFTGGTGTGYLFFATYIQGSDWGSARITYPVAEIWDDPSVITLGGPVICCPHQITGAGVFSFTYGVPFQVTLSASAGGSEGTSHTLAEIDGIAVLDSSFNQVAYFNTPPSTGETFLVAAPAPEPATIFGVTLVLAGLLLYFRKTHPGLRPE